jgi:hypothetical protein
MQPYFKGDCADIEDIGFDSHVPCYLTPGDGLPSICDLSFSDWFGVFWIVKVSLISSKWY